mmetsp:Transcript_5267/g.11451  ORF Transcript_5267/g.11451 Transcript_5267/m.11451 type:complete len:190 (-) Transcript_5267:124-693(-)
MSESDRHVASLPKWQYVWYDYLGNRRIGVAVLLPLGVKLKQPTDTIVLGDLSSPALIGDLSFTQPPSRQSLEIGIKWPDALFDSEKLLSHRIFGNLFPPGCMKQSRLQYAMKHAMKESVMSLTFEFAASLTPTVISGHDAIVVAKYNENDPEKAALVLHLDLIQDNPTYPPKSQRFADTTDQDDDFAVD